LSRTPWDGRAIDGHGAGQVEWALVYHILNIVCNIVLCRPQWSGI